VIGVDLWIGIGQNKGRNLSEYSFNAYSFISCLYIFDKVYKMGKYFVTIANRQRAYKVCRDDINKVFSCKIKKSPKLPAYH
jgi:hypothetical protein